MARNFKELQAKMDPASRADNTQLVREELRRMALEELRSAKQLTQSDMAEMLDVPQSSISRIEQRADMYLSTLRNYIHAVGGELRIQAVFPDGGTVVIDRFGEYEERPYVVEAIAETGGVFRLRARPLHHEGSPLSTKPFRGSGLTKAMRALHLPEVQIASIKTDLETNAGRIEIGGSGPSIQRVFSAQDLAAAGFEEANAE
ncbi:MAG TPA: XRE family transcriptional regulator [Candidatus Sulfopaludibacter sp.]|jgi:transcriptional regulator with XRE-family HTH domain|nr:XRE family transcriptional regulator [Candidatus Sulfopaludibacter sp.]